MYPPARHEALSSRPHPRPKSCANSLCSCRRRTPAQPESVLRRHAARRNVKWMVGEELDRRIRALVLKPKSLQASLARSPSRRNSACSMLFPGPTPERARQPQHEQQTPPHTASRDNGFCPTGFFLRHNPEPALASCCPFSCLAATAFCRTACRQRTPQFRSPFFGRAPARSPLQLHARRGSPLSLPGYTPPPRLRS
jgi:hypothetical protein